MSAFRRTDASIVFMSFSVCAAFSASSDRFEVLESLVLWVCVSVGVGLLGWMKTLVVTAKFPLFDGSV